MVRSKANKNPSKASSQPKKTGSKPKAAPKPAKQQNSTSTKPSLPRPDNTASEEPHAPANIVEQANPIPFSGDDEMYATDPELDEPINDEETSDDEHEKLSDIEMVEVIEASGSEVEVVESKKRGPYKKKESASVAEPLPEYFTISYQLLVYSSEVMKEPRTRRKGEGTSLSLKSDLSWLDFRDQLLIKIGDVLYPTGPIVNLDNFKIECTVPRHIKDALTLKTEDNYRFMVQQALLAKTHQSAKIWVEEVIPQCLSVANKENGAIESGTAAQVGNNEQPKKKPTKSSVPKEAQILPANVAMNDKVKQLRDQWMCHTTTCHSDHCFIPAEGPHLRLTHEHFEKWAAAILKDTATLQTPPNIKLFDAVDPRALAARSPLLQARLNANAKDKAPQPTPTVNCTIVLPDDLGGARRNLVLPPHTNHSSTGIILGHLQPGRRMPIEEFCDKYDLPANILASFQKNAYRNSYAFRHITDSHLKEMGLLPGEIVDLKEAVEEWAIAGL